MHARQHYQSHAVHGRDVHVDNVSAEAAGGGRIRGMCSCRLDHNTECEDKGLYVLLIYMGEYVLECMDLVYDLYCIDTVKIPCNNIQGIIIQSIGNLGQIHNWRSILQSIL